MAKFDKDDPSGCPQCGDEAGFIYHEPKSGVVSCAVAGAVQNEPHMPRNFVVCTYEWAEEPAV